MTRPLGAGVPSPVPPVNRSRRHFTPGAAGGETARGFRNQTITEFFKPVLNQDIGYKDRTVLCSPGRGNVTEAGIDLSVLSPERLEKKIPSPKNVRIKKMPDHTPNTSPILDAFRRGVKEEKDNVNASENVRTCEVLDALCPKVMVQRLFATASRSCFLAKKDKTVGSEQGRTEKCLGVMRAPLSCGNSWEEKGDPLHLEDVRSETDKWLSSSEGDNRTARSNGPVNNTSLCPNPGLPVAVPCPDAEFRASPEGLHRKRKWNEHRIKPSKPCPAKPFSGTSVSHQENECLLLKRPLPCLKETASDDPSQPKRKQLSEHEVSSPNALRTSSEVAADMRKSQTVPSRCLRFKFASGRSKQIDVLGERRHAAPSVDAGSSKASELSSLSDAAFVGSPAKLKIRRSAFVKNIFLKSAGGDVVQLIEPAALAGHDSTLPEGYLNPSDENKSNHSFVGLSSSYSAQSSGKNNHVSGVDTKENQLQVANSRFLLEKSLPFSQEKSTLLPSLHHLTQTKSVGSSLQTAGLSQGLDAKKEQDGKRPERHVHNEGYGIRSGSSYPKIKGKTSENASNSCSVEGSGKPALSEETGKSVPSSLSVKERCTDSDHLCSQLSELQVENTPTNKHKPNTKSKSSSDSEDESLDCGLDEDDDGDDEEVFVPLKEIISSSPKPEAGTLDESCLDSFSQPTLSPLLKLHLSKTPVVSQVSYVNSLEHLLKEKEESKRVDELEKQLQEDIQEREIDSAVGDDEESAGGDEDLSEEHRAFIKRFSVIAHAIPDYHPGEEIFDFSTSGKIFSQHDLDLRNFHVIPQNPIENLLLSSDVTQQLSLATNGFLSSAYSCTLCPVPILKWLFQVMSVHPDYCVSTRVLDRLMEITLKNAYIRDEQSKPWIPSLADVSAVFINMGVAFRSLFPLQHLQPNFNEHDILLMSLIRSQMQEVVSEPQPRGHLTSADPMFSNLLENNLINVIKFLVFCTTVVPGGYTDQEILLLLLLLFKISLEKQLKQIPLIDFQCLFVKLLMSIEDWDAKMPELCLALSELSSHHHNLLWLVQLVPSWIIRGREVRRRLSLVVISKLLDKSHVEIPDDCDEQMSLLHHFLVCMKPSNLLKKMREGQEQRSDSGDHLPTELEQKAYYLLYILLHLVSEASFFDVVTSNQRQHLLKLCGALDKHIKCDIREDARLFYRTKVKDLVARIYGKWQDMIQTLRPTQGKLHDFWEPDS